VTYGTSLRESSRRGIVAQEGAEIAIKALAVHYFEMFTHQTSRNGNFVSVESARKAIGDKLSPKK